MSKLSLLQQQILLIDSLSIFDFSVKDKILVTARSIANLYLVMMRMRRY